MNVRGLFSSEAQGALAAHCHQLFIELLRKLVIGIDVAQISIAVSHIHGNQLMLGYQSTTVSQYVAVPRIFLKCTVLWPWTVVQV